MNRSGGLDRLKNKVSKEIKNLEAFEGVFIRAPRIEQVGKDVEVLYEWNHEPVMVRQGFILASTFHPELTESNHLHKYFVSLCEESG